MDVPALLDRVRYASDMLEYWECGQQLAMSGCRRATRGLMAIVRESTEPERRKAALHALWTLNDARATPLFLQFGVSGETEMLRVVAVEGLGVSIRRRRVQEAVARYLSDPSVSVRYSALCAAAKLNYRPKQFMIPSLRRALESSVNDPASLYEEGDVSEFARRILEQGC